MTAVEARRLLAAGLAVAALAFGVAACGDSDDNGGSDGAAASGGSDEEAVTAVLDEMGARLADEDYAGACELMATEARKAFVATASQMGVDTEGSPEAVCGKVFAASAQQVTLQADLEPEITSVKIAGGQATVTATQSHDDKPAKAQLLREGGGWRVVTYYTN